MSRKYTRLSIRMLSCAVLSTLCFLLLFAASPVEAGRRFLTFGTAGVNGVYFPVGGSICHLVNRKSKEYGIRCMVEATGGSIFNLESIRNNDLDVGFAQSDWQANAYNGGGIFAEKGADKNLRSLFSLHSEALTIVARPDANISSFDDLRGKRVNIGIPGSGVRATVDELMAVKGWKPSVFKELIEFSTPDQTRRLCSGQIDAFVPATGHPNGLVQEVTSMCNARLVTVADEDVSKLLARHSYYSQATVPGGMYAGNPFDVHTFGVKATVVASKDVGDDVVYHIVKELFDNLEDFKTTHPILATLNKQSMIKNGLVAPLHEGAKRYYKEVGLLQ